MSQTTQTNVLNHCIQFPLDFKALISYASAFPFGFLANFIRIKESSMLGSSMPISMLQNMMGAGQNNIQNNMMSAQLAAAMQSAAMPKSTSTQAANADTVTISMSANMLQQFLNSEMQGTDRTVGEGDWTALSQIQQQGEMLSTLIKSKLKGFESNLIGSMKSGGFDPSQSMSLKDGGENGLLLDGAMQNDPFQQFLSKNNQLQNQFQEVSQLVDALNSLQQITASLPKQNGMNLASVLQNAANAKQSADSTTTEGKVAPPAADALTPNAAAVSAKYAKQSQVSSPIGSPAQKQPGAQFVLRFMQGKTSYAYE